jgi:hypothetical protein
MKQLNHYLYLSEYDINFNPVQHKNYMEFKIEVFREFIDELFINRSEY